jgi:hypothetical protein
MIMQFEQDGDYLKITLRQEDGTYEVRYMHRIDAAPMLQHIKLKSVVNPESNLVAPTEEELLRYQ